MIASLEYFFLKEKNIHGCWRGGALLEKDRNTIGKITSGHCITNSAILEQMIRHAFNQKRRSLEAYHDKPSSSGYKKIKSQKSINKSVDGQ